MRVPHDELLERLGAALNVDDEVMSRARMDNAAFGAEERRHVVEEQQRITGGNTRKGSRLASSLDDYEAGHGSIGVSIPHNEHRIIKSIIFN